MPKPRTNAGWPAILLVIVLLLPAVYMGAYYAMLDCQPSVYNDPPKYRYGTDDRLFALAHGIDKRHVRLEGWASEIIEWEEDVYVPAVPN